MKRVFMLMLIGGLMMLAVVVLAKPMRGSTSTATAVGTVDVWLTTGDQSSSLHHSYVALSPGNGSNPQQIQVTENITYQQMDGFGAALTDSAAWLISTTLNMTQTHTLMNKLFSPSEGIGISYVRLPMGASDFVTSTHYTYDDIPLGETDPDLDFFSIAHDQAYIIPILQEAKSINPQLRFMGSPWSAPAWMKSPETLYGGSLQPGYHQTYANYFVKFIQSYEAEDIPIHSITIQNEPHYTSTTCPTMWMEPDQQAQFIKNHLGPAFVDAGITNTKVLIWDHNWDEPNYPLGILSDTGARAYVAGSAWHCYAGAPDAQTSVHEVHPDKEIYFTECTGGEWDTDFASVLVWNFQNLFIGAVRHRAKAVLLWNLALDENHGPNNGGCDDCRGVVTIHRDSGEVDYNVEYYVIGHLSKFVDPGAYRVDSDHFPETLESVAFQNPDGSIVLVVLNPGITPKLFDVKWRGQYFSYSLDPQSVVTFKWNEQRVYLPLVLRTYRPPTSFQNFEPDNGTPGDYCLDVWFAACLSEFTVVHDGIQSISVHAHAEADGDPGDHGGTVGIHPSSSDSIDLSSATTISIWVYDTQGNNDVELRLCDASGCSDGVWSEEKASQNEWTKITWGLSDFTGVDRSEIKNIELYEWNDGIYYFDAIEWH